MNHIWFCLVLFFAVSNRMRRRVENSHDYVLECAQDANGPAGQTCNLVSKACVDPSQPVCGSGVAEFGGACDADKDNTDSYTIAETGMRPCNASCSGASPHCGYFQVLSSYLFINVVTDDVASQGKIGCDDELNVSCIIGEPHRFIQSV